MPEVRRGEADLGGQHDLAVVDRGLRPVDRLVEEREVMRRLPERAADLDRRRVLRVAPDPHLRFDTNDYSLDPNPLGRRVEVRVSQREIAADDGEVLFVHFSDTVRRLSSKDVNNLSLLKLLSRVKTLLCWGQ